MFKCNKCGKCCRNLKNNIIYSNLDRGDGVCKYLKDNLCSIYNERPILCRVDECYNLFFKDIYTRENFYKLNKEICKTLK